jgi:hypothetical protein
MAALDQFFKLELVGDLISFISKSWLIISRWRNLDYPFVLLKIFEAELRCFHLGRHGCVKNSKRNIRPKTRYICITVTPLNVYDHCCEVHCWRITWILHRDVCLKMQRNLCVSIQSGFRAMQHGQCRYVSYSEVFGADTQ